MCSICKKVCCHYHAYYLFLLKSKCDWQWILSCCHWIAPMLFLHVVLIFFNRITNVWSEWMVCTVCSYIGSWLTVVFFPSCSFLQKTLHLLQVLCGNKPFPDAPQRRFSSSDSSTCHHLLHGFSYLQAPFLVVLSLFCWLHSHCI